jgi:hypothetical protein
METIEAAQITCTVYHPVTEKALDALDTLGVQEYHLEPSRAVVLRRRAGFLGIGAGIVLEEEPADRILLYVPAAAATAALQALVASCELDIPGRGSAVCEEVAIVRGSAWEEQPLTPVPGTDTVATQSGLTSLTCTVQQGRGDNIIKAVLGLGVPMPQVTTGVGTGLRDKLGLIRVALPAEKEVVHAVVSSHEATDILDSLVNAGRLDQFGSGFIYESPLARGVVNSMVIRGQRHSASIEQLIAVVDNLMGSTDWRKRSLGGNDPSRKHNYLYDLVSLTLICNQGRASDLVQAAMAAGAAGATLSKLSHARTDGIASPVSPAREMTELVIGQEVVEAIAGALEAEGVFDQETAGLIALKPVTLACTHRGAHR